MNQKNSVKTHSLKKTHDEVDEYGGDVTGTSLRRDVGIGTLAAPRLSHHRGQQEPPEPAVPVVPEARPPPEPEGPAEG